MSAIDHARRRSQEMNELHKQFADEDYKQNQADLKSLLQMPAFRRVFVAIIKRACLYGSIDGQGEALAWSVGFRELGVEIYMNCNNADGEMVLKAIGERNEIERDRRARMERFVGNEVGTKGNN